MSSCERADVYPETWETLSTSERIAIDLYARGSARAAIAARLRVSKSTVSHLLGSVKDKLYADTLAHAAALYHKHLDGRA